jgi:hypothetical protein
MRFKAKKVYGQSKEVNCPFCGRLATQKNETGIEVCSTHTKSVLEEIKCTCGSWLEQRDGKFGPYFNCLNCGNFNYKRGMEMKAITGKKVDVSKATKKPVDKSTFISSIKKEPKVIEITSHDVEYFD